MDRSPTVSELAWGRVATDGGQRYKDAKLWPGGGREWDWAETGTAHEPGTQLSDVEELLDHGADVVVLTRGQQERLQVPQDTVSALEQRGVEVHIDETERAVRHYNELARQGRAVGALIHSTC